MIKFFIFLSYIINSFIFGAPKCKVGLNFCTKCNPVLNLCVKCSNSHVLTPDENGGCTGITKCELGKNYCEECNEKNTICKTCNSGYFPDENGGCSYIPNCEVSYLGECLICKEDYFLVEDSKFCKSLTSEDFLNCKEINKSNGFCKECESGFYLNTEDKKCSSTENCYESIYGKCISCNKDYYFDQTEKEKKCKAKTGKDVDIDEIFIHCKETEDGKNCATCDEGFFFDSDGKCVDTNYCSNSKNLECTECIDDYFLSKIGKKCVSTENCEIGDGETGICERCLKKFYLDLNDGLCKSNREEDDLKYCYNFTDKCESCEEGYFLGTDNRCSDSKFCSEAENGVCKNCTGKYFINKNHQCTTDPLCIDFMVDPLIDICFECEEGYTVSKKNRNTCIKSEGSIINCKVADIFNDSKCMTCRDDFYFSQNKSTCISNEDDESPFYKCLKADKNEKTCLTCIKNYFLGDKDKRCTTVKNCALSNDKHECTECTKNYCLNVKNQTCNSNKEIKDDNEKIYYRCLKTDKEGKKCEKCNENFYEINDKGYCVDYEENCEEKNDEGECIKCYKRNQSSNKFCLNKDFGCINNQGDENCLRCDGDFDFSNNCTECREGYELRRGEFGNMGCAKVVNQ